MTPRLTHFRYIPRHFIAYFQRNEMQEEKSPCFRSYHVSLLLRRCIPQFAMSLLLLILILFNGLVVTQRIWDIWCSHPFLLAPPVCTDVPQFGQAGRSCFYLMTWAWAVLFYSRFSRPARSWLAAVFPLHLFLWKCIYTLLLHLVSSLDVMITTSADNVPWYELDEKFYDNVMNGLRQAIHICSFLNL